MTSTDKISDNISCHDHTAERDMHLGGEGGYLGINTHAMTKSSNTYTVLLLRDDLKSLAERDGGQKKSFIV